MYVQENSWRFLLQWENLDLSKYIRILLELWNSMQHPQIKMKEQHLQTERGLEGFFTE